MLFNRFLFISILGLCFGFLAWAANAADLVVNEGGYVVDCADLEANDGCYEHPECCKGDFERLQGEVYDTFEPNELCKMNYAAYYVIKDEDGIVTCVEMMGSDHGITNECSCSFIFGLDGRVR